MRNKLKSYKFKVTQKVAWGDMDALGHVNNTVFAKYFENARAEYILMMQGRLDDFHMADHIFVITHLELRYRGQVFFPQSLCIQIGLMNLSSRTMTLGCVMINESDQIVCSGSSEHILINRKTARAVRIPEKYTEFLKELNK